MKNLPEFQPGQSVYDVHTALKCALKRLDKAQHCSVLWFGEILDRELFKELPKISEKIASEELGWTKAREITKITDESNQDEMLDYALNNSRRDVEEMLRKKKNLPSGKVDALLEIMAGCLEDTSLEKTTRVEVPETSNTQGVRNNKTPVQLHVHHCPE